VSRPIRVTHVITGLEVGGAEVILTRLLAQLDPAAHPGCVISLTGRGPLAEAVESAGFDVVALELRRLPGPLGLRRLLAAIRASDPDVVQTWLLHSNVLAGSLAAARKVAPVAWSIHMTEATAATEGRRNVWLQSAEARLSRSVPARIISCSYSTYALMERSGYEMERSSVIPNGFDLDALRPDPAAPAAVREELAIPADASLVVHAARLHPTKDHATMLRAASIVAAARPNVHFLLCGEGVVPGAPGIAPEAERIGERVHLLGRRSDLPRLFAAADVAALSSVSEAMPLVIGEAMACGTPVAATDCGDSAELVGETGRIAPVRDPEALAAGILDLLDGPPERRRELGEEARGRIADRYSMAAMVGGYEDVWAALAPRRSSTSE
jgi:glycosyltransferase involved in cell wall biosynthesis